MRIIQINATAGVGSTGKICMGISTVLNEQRIENYVLFSGFNCSSPNAIKYANKLEIKLEAGKSRVFGNYGFNSKHITRRLVALLDQLQPDVIHLHNLHGHNVNLQMLFDYIRKHGIKTIWTFHDCWAFTGYCSHFTMVKCEQWRTYCSYCPQKKGTTWFFDRSKQIFERKKSIIAGIDLTITTPSQWLADLVKQSFFQDHPIKVIPNGIDLDVFKPTLSRFREKYGLKANEYMILGVAFDWGERKGLDVFIELAKRLDSRFHITLVGTSKMLDRKLPQNIISVHRTQSQQELAEIYAAADLFVNPTREEVLGLVNIESLACGTPVVTFRTGGSPECVDDTCGSVIDCDDFAALEQEIIRICTTRPFEHKACICRAKRFDLNRTYQAYVDLYRNIEKSL